MQHVQLWISRVVLLVLVSYYILYVLLVVILVLVLVLLSIAYLVLVLGLVLLVVVVVVECYSISDISSNSSNISRRGALLICFLPIKIMITTDSTYRISEYLMIHDNWYLIPNIKFCKSVLLNYCYHKLEYFMLDMNLGIRILSPSWYVLVLLFFIYLFIFFVYWESVLIVLDSYWWCSL